jgi:hypothetical protein
MMVLNSFGDSSALPASRVSPEASVTDVAGASPRWNATDTAVSSPDAGAIAALEFLERSREVASERVVDGRRSQTSPSQSEEVAAPGSRSSV